MAKVLVVDASLSVRKVVERALLARKMEVVCAATGGEALERIERDEPDVVVCDVVMPDKDVRDLRVREGPPTPGTDASADVSGISTTRCAAGRAGKSADVLSKRSPPTTCCASSIRCSRWRRVGPGARPSRRTEPAPPAVAPARRHHGTHGESSKGRALASRRQGRRRAATAARRS